MPSIAISAVNAGTDTLTAVAHGLTTGDRCRVRTNDSLPQRVPTRPRLCFRPPRRFAISEAGRVVQLARCSLPVSRDETPISSARRGVISGPGARRGKSAFRGP